ncbi:MAG: hypothetical protein L3J11_11190, partial [Draconibacterium sp.]|nr:hypothetical protein [Draconibacterium sp.]
MKKSNFIRLLSSMFLISMIVFSCTPSKKDFSYSKGGDIWFRGPGVELRFDQNMKVAVFYKGE